MANEFGEFIKHRRLEKDITLRKMASRLDIAASYLSDIEKGRRYAPDKSKLIQIIEILDIKDKDRDILFDLAGKTKDDVAPDLPEYINTNEHVRVLLRKARDKKTSDEKINNFIKMLDEE